MNPFHIFALKIVVLLSLQAAVTYSALRWTKKSWVQALIVLVFGITALHIGLGVL